MMEDYTYQCQWIYYYLETRSTNGQDGGVQSSTFTSTGKQCVQIASVQIPPLPLRFFLRGRGVLYTGYVQIAVREAFRLWEWLKERWAGKTARSGVRSESEGTLTLPSLFFISLRFGRTLNSLNAWNSLYVITTFLKAASLFTLSGQQNYGTE